MPTITLDHGGHADGYVWVSVNGYDKLIKVGEPVELPTSYVDALDHANLTYTIHVGDADVAPLIFADFKNGVYMVDGEAVAMSDLLEESETYTGWNPALITPGVGLDCTSEGTNFRLKKAQFASLGDGATIVPSTAGETSLRVRMMDDPGFNNMFPLRMDFVDGGGATIIVADGAGPQVTDEDLGASSAKAAFSATLIRIAGSLNGRDPVGMDVSYDATAHPFDTSVVTVASGVLESIGWYPLQDEADLPDLSTVPLPTLPDGFAFVVDGEDAYVVDGDGKYIVMEI